MPPQRQNLAVGNTKLVAACASYGCLASDGLDRRRGFVAQAAAGVNFTGGFQYRIGGGANVGMDALEVAQDVEMQRRRFEGVLAALA